MSVPVLDRSSLAAALTLRDLTDPSQGAHAMQRLLDDLVTAVAAVAGAQVRVCRALPIVTARDNYDRLYIPADAVTRDARYTRWLGPGVLLRTQTSAMIPPLLDALADDPTWDDVLLVCPGLVYRRDCIDRLHVGEPHQVDLWRISRSRVLGDAELTAMIAAVVGAALPGWRHRTIAAEHPYTIGGRQIDAGDPGIEIGECGLASPRVLGDARLGDATGLAMGLGLDRLLMLRKRLDDIRLLRSSDPRIASQMQDLASWRPVSTMPPARRDLSIAVDGVDDAELLGDRVRAALGARASSVESVTIVSDTPHDALPPAARARLGISPGQRNLLVRVVLRDLDRTLSADDANRLRDAIYAALHRGTVWQWAAQRHDPAPV